MLIKRRLPGTDIVIAIFLGLLAVIWIVPAVTAAQTSMKVNGIGNYVLVLTTKIEDVFIFGRMAINSIVVSTLSIILILAVSILAAFAFSKLRFRGRTVLYIGILGCYAIPIISALIPDSILISRLGLRGTLVSMVLLLTTANLPLSLLIFKGNFDGLSNAYMEAAKIDGSSDFSTLVRVIVPMSQPAIINVVVVVFIQVWNNFQIPLIFATRPALYTLPLAPRFFGLTQNRLDLPPLYASIIIIAVPVILFYLLMQDRIIRGLTLGGLKE